MHLDCAQNFCPNGAKIPHLRGERYFSGRRSRRIKWIPILFRHLRMAKLCEAWTVRGLKDFAVYEAAVVEILRESWYNTLIVCFLER